MSRPSRSAAWLGLLVWGWVASSAAQGGPDDPRAAVRYARNAFEYRDFATVERVLWPWLHPPRIADQELRIQAHELLGISLFILDKRELAREEFSKLLIASPDHQLDPFVVPPDVIQDFEAIRKAMEPTLRQIRDKVPVRPADPEPTTEVKRELVEVPHWSVAYVPFGVPQFVLERPGWGGFWLSTQLVGLAVNGGAFWAASSIQNDSAEFDLVVGLQYAGLAVFGLSYLSSVIQANNLLRERRELLLTKENEPPNAPLEE